MRVSWCARPTVWKSVLSRHFRLQQLRIHDLALAVNVGEVVVHLLEEMLHRILIVGGDGEADRDIDLVVFHRASIVSEN